MRRPAANTRLGLHAALLCLARPAARAVKRREEAAA